MRTRAEIEYALDARCLWAKMNNGNFWQVRRNGKTVTWKRDPDRFRIPIKLGLRNYGQIDQDNLQSEELVISNTQPAKWR